MLLSVDAVAVADPVFEELAEKDSSCLAATDLHFLLRSQTITFHFDSNVGRHRRMKLKHHIGS